MRLGTTNRIIFCQMVLLWLRYSSGFVSTWALSVARSQSVVCQALRHVSHLSTCTMITQCQHGYWLRYNQSQIPADQRTSLGVYSCEFVSVLESIFCEVVRDIRWIGICCAGSGLDGPVSSRDSVTSRCQRAKNHDIPDLSDCELGAQHPRADPSALHGLINSYLGLGLTRGRKTPIQRPRPGELPRRSCVTRTLTVSAARFNERCAHTSFHISGASRRAGSCDGGTFLPALGVAHRGPPRDRPVKTHGRLIESWLTHGA